jgi:hypothetical protein
MVSNDLIEKCAKASAFAEGFGKPNSIPTRANNPGDLTDDGNLGYGVIDSEGPHGAAITIYPNVTDGWAALYRKWRRALTGASEVYTLRMTIAQIGLKWSGDPEWAKNFAENFGCSPLSVLSDLVDADLGQQEEV